MCVRTVRGGCDVTLRDAALNSSINAGLTRVSDPGVAKVNKSWWRKRICLPCFREDSCKSGFAELQCQDLDLLHISQMIARQGNSVASVGACLCIEGKLISEIEKDESCTKLMDKVHKILLQWQWKNTCNATWASLIKSLQRLDEQKLMECIQTYLSQKEYPMEGIYKMWDCQTSNGHRLMLQHLAVSPNKQCLIHTRLKNH